MKQYLRKKISKLKTTSTQNTCVLTACLVRVKDMLSVDLLCLTENTTSALGCAAALLSLSGLHAFPSTSLLTVVSVSCCLFVKPCPAVGPRN